MSRKVNVTPFLAVRVDVTDWRVLEVACAGDAGLLTKNYVKLMFEGSSSACNNTLWLNISPVQVTSSSYQSSWEAFLVKKQDKKKRSLKYQLSRSNRTVDKYTAKLKSSLNTSFPCLFLLHGKSHGGKFCSHTLFVITSCCCFAAFQ